MLNHNGNHGDMTLNVEIKLKSNVVLKFAVFGKVK